jgi:hypothetical protein
MVAGANRPLAFAIHERGPCLDGFGGWEDLPKTMALGGISRPYIDSSLRPLSQTENATYVPTVQSNNRKDCR